jgi:DNA protecting protein DprA
MPRSKSWIEGEDGKVSIAELGAVLLLSNRVRFLGPQKIRDLYRSGTAASELIADPTRLTLRSSRLQDFQNQIRALGPEALKAAMVTAEGLVQEAERLQGSLISYGSRWYPDQLWRSNYAIPLLHARGNVEVLKESRTVACVGSRTTRGLYASLHQQLAEQAARKGMVIVSGFALGADTIGHAAAERVGGKTVGVMAGGLARPFPPENKELWNRLLSYPGAAFVSEAGWGRRADALTLRKRNKLIVALSAGVFVSQSAADGGAMNAYRFALENKKPVATIAADGSPSTTGNALMETDRDHVTAISPEDASSGWDRWLGRLGSST